MIKFNPLTLLVLASINLLVAAVSQRTVTPQPTDDYEQAIRKQLYDIQQDSKTSENNIFYKREQFLNYIWSKDRKDLPEDLLDSWYTRSNADLANVLYMFYKYRTLKTVLSKGFLSGLMSYRFGKRACQR